MTGFIKVASTYSSTLKRAVPSALVGLTSLFGMGRGGPHCYRHLKLLNDEYGMLNLEKYSLHSAFIITSILVLTNWRLK